MPLWVLAALLGALAQTGRNAMQASLTAAIGTVGATQVRFLFGLPFALLFLLGHRLLTGEPVPLPGPVAIGWTLAGSLAQIAATALMLKVMQSRGFGVTTAWLKVEPVLVALLGAVLLGDALAPGAVLAMAVAVAGVLILSVKPGQGIARFFDGGPAALGLLAGLAFGVAAIGFRGGITSLPDGSFAARALTILALSLAIQAGLLLAWMAVADRRALAASFAVWRASLGAGFLGAFASAFWFIGFSLTSAANVRTVALVEVVFAQAVATFVFRQSVTRRQLLGMAVMLAGVAALMQQQG